MLQIKNIDTYYDGVQALSDVTFEVGKDEIISIIGANGAGKTTLMKSVMGLVHPKKGNIYFRGKEITHMKTSDIVRQGIVYIPEGRKVFPRLSVRDNLEMGAYSKKYTAAELNKKLEEIYEIFPRLGERKKQKAGSLSGGEQQMLAIGRGLMSAPEFLMYDEPSLGLAPVIVDEMFEIIVRVAREMKIPSVVVEQNAFMAMTISNRTYVLENGRIVNEGKSSVLFESPEIKKAYLGG